MAQSLQAEHHVSFSGRDNQYVDVILSLPVTTEDLVLIMPNWTPGSYLIRDYAAQVERLRVSGAGDSPLDVRKVAKNRWHVRTAGEDYITVNYSVWSGELGVNSSWVEPDFALLNGAGIFLFSEASRNWPQRVSVELPDEWKWIYTALPQLGNETQYVASDYDELVDSPLLLGNAPAYPFEVLNQEYILVNQGETALWDGPQSAQDVARIVTAVQSFWEINPFDRPYLFLNIISEGSGGLEHDNSAVVLASPWQMRNRQEYIDWLALVTHEFFHAWNVRRMRPEALQDYDYEQEAYTRELWLAEGLSSYYDNLLLLRSGLIKVDEYLTLLASEFHHYETTPGRQVRSAESASFDAWIKQYKPDANTINSAVSYYRKGALIGFVADMVVRKNTDNQSSLDTLMREMYRRYGPQGSNGGGYPPGAFQALVGTVAGAAAQDQVERLLSTVADPDIDAALTWYGLQLDRAPARTAAMAVGQPEPVDFGLIWDTVSASLVVGAVLQGGSGAAAGVLPADELLAINNTRVTKENIADRMLRLMPGENVQLLLVRHGSLLTLAVTAQGATPDKFQISINPAINRRQKERMSAWLGVKLKFITNDNN